MTSRVKESRKTMHIKQIDFIFQCVWTLITHATCPLSSKGLLVSQGEYKPLWRRELPATCSILLCSYFNVISTHTGKWQLFVSRLFFRSLEFCQKLVLVQIKAHSGFMACR